MASSLSVSMMVIVALSVLTLALLGDARSAPFMPVQDDFYSEIRDILEERFNQNYRGMNGMNSKMGAVPHPVEVTGWRPTITLGEVVGVAVDLNGDPIILHRAGRVWDPRSFNATHHMQDNSRLPEDTVVVLDQNTAAAKASWGANTFLMPHGITVAPDGHVWITDVGLHQVIKFSGVNHHPLMTLGEAEVPGTDGKHFCQPTSTAISTEGDVFVADGYCNNRVMRFSADGKFLAQFGYTGTGTASNTRATMHLPHGLALDEPLDALCVADRQGRRVVCYRAGLGNQQAFGTLVAVVPDPDGHRVFDVAALGGGVVLGIAGSTAEGVRGSGFTADLASGAMLNHWGPREGLRNPHSVAVSPDGSTLYIAEMVPNIVWKFRVNIEYPRYYG